MFQETQSYEPQARARTADRRKRAYVRPQKAQAAPETAAEWSQAEAAFIAAERAHEAACEAAGIYRGKDHNDETRRSLAAFNEARDRLLSTPSMNGPALAFKLAVYLAWIGGVTDGDLRIEDERRWIAKHGDDDDKAALAIYLDALRLGHAPRRQRRDHVDPPPGYEFDAAGFVADYRALGGDMQLIFDGSDGRELFGIRYPEESCARADEMEAELIKQPWKRTLVIQHLREAGDVDS